MKKDFYKMREVNSEELRKLYEDRDAEALVWQRIEEKGVANRVEIFKNV